MPRKTKAPAPRTRRTQADARQQILDATERRLLEAGPGAIRIQDVAADVGVSHPTVLHHFGNRAGLVRAVVERSVRALEEDLLAAISAGEVIASGRPDTQALFRRVYEVLAERGHARLIAWLVLAGDNPFTADVAHDGWTKIAELTHALRIMHTKVTPKPTLEDTRFTVLLSAFVLFTRAISGRALFDAAGYVGDAKVDDRFGSWFAALIEEHMEHPRARARSGP